MRSRQSDTAEAEESVNEVVEEQQEGKKLLQRKQQQDVQVVEREVTLSLLNQKVNYTNQLLEQLVTLIK